jgi:heme/copper-type cytochrome/quinol oxidase subunit 3
MDTVLKGFVFLMYQAYEYTSSMFSITDSIYSSVFYSLTGLHGIHVFVGVTFLFVFVLVTTQTKKYTTSNEKTIKIIN